MITARRKKKLNPMLIQVVGASGAVHLLALLVLGGITVVRYVIPGDAAFEEPPAIEEEEPPPPVKVEIKQRPAQLDQSLANLRLKQIGNISVANVSVDLPSMQDSFTVSAGIGSFSGSSLIASTRGSIGFGASDVSVFGVKARSEKVLFIIDAGAYMLADTKGGLNSYRTIKKEIGSMVSSLSAGTLFNVILFDELTTQFFRPSLVPAGSNIASELNAWLGPVNEKATDVGLPKKPQRPITPLQGEAVGHFLMLDRNVDRGNVNLYLMQLAFEQGADTVFLITGIHHGFSRLRRPMNAEEQRDWDEHTASNDYRRRLQEHRAERPTVRARVLAEVKRMNVERRRAGIPDVVFHGPDPIMWASEVGVFFENRHPGHAPAYFVDPRVVKSYTRKLIDHLYFDRALEEPSFNVILFLAEDEVFSKEAEKGLRSFTRFLDGRHRIIRGAKQIKLTIRPADKNP